MVYKISDRYYYEEKFIIMFITCIGCNYGRL